MRIELMLWTIRNSFLGSRSIAAARQSLLHFSDSSARRIPTSNDCSSFQGQSSGQSLLPVSAREESLRDGEAEGTPSKPVGKHLTQEEKLTSNLVTSATPEMVGSHCGANR